MKTDTAASEPEQYDALAAYTMSHSSPAFIHQHVVDAFAAQQASATTKPIALAFALAGLYLYLERRFTGRQVQRVHALLARRTTEFPVFTVPESRGTISVHDVMAAAAGAERDSRIEAWCASVWEAHHANRAAVLAFLARHDIG